MNKLAFNIKNLSCQYPSSEHPVLEIDSLEIPETAVVFFIGASGVGKSTVLETLGLMNNTIVVNENSVFDFKPGQNVEEKLLTIWRKNERYIARFRRQHLSFIFQSTNLFPTLTAYGNVMLIPMLRGASRKTSLEKVKGIFRDVLPELKGDRKISELSGGQRQRLAFARAIVTDAAIICADEPTGNLDWANADKLMRFLVNDIKQKGKTAIIVSHDIGLALKYADVIVLIKKCIAVESEKKYLHGRISDKDVYRRKSGGEWNGVEGSEITALKLREWLEESLINQAN